MLHERVEQPIHQLVNNTEFKAAVSTDNCFVAGRTLNLASRGARILVEEGTPTIDMINSKGELWLDHNGKELEIPCRILRINLDEIIVAFTNPDLNTMISLKTLIEQ